MMLESDEQVQREVEERTGTRPCIWQIQVVHKVLEGGDIITIAATGSGKTFTYWMVLLYVKHSIVLLITPLKLLGKQFVDVLSKNDLKAVSMTAANATNAVFKVCLLSLDRRSLAADHTLTRSLQQGYTN
jgi:superfamily II DNA/RNA helicase